MRTILCLLVLSFAIQAEEPTKPKVGQNVEVKNTPAWLIDEDTTAIMAVQIRSILDFLPIKNRLNRKVVAELKKSTLLRQFEFDPLTELSSAQFAISETRDSTALLSGDFRRERRRTPLLVEGGNDSYAQFVNDTTLLLATTKPKLEELIIREFKPLTLKPDKQPLLAAIPAKPTGSVLWIASRWPSFFATGDLLSAVGIAAVSPNLIKASPVFFMTIGIEKADVVFRWTVPATDPNQLAEWQAYLDKIADAYKAFAPLFAAQAEAFKPLVDESIKSIGVKIEDKKAVVLSFRVTITSLDKALDVLMPGDDK